MPRQIMPKVQFGASQDLTGQGNCFFYRMREDKNLELNGYFDVAEKGDTITITNPITGKPVDTTVVTSWPEYPIGARSDATVSLPPEVIPDFEKACPAPEPEPEPAPPKTAAEERMDAVKSGLRSAWAWLGRGGQPE